MEVVKGASFKIKMTIYDQWTGDFATSVPANLAGATIKFIMKSSATDRDNQALLTEDGIVIDAVKGWAEVSVDAADTKDLSYTSVVYENVIKLSSGKIIRTGMKGLTFVQNVMKVTP